MILLVAGDVTPRDVRRFAQKYYGNLPGGRSRRDHSHSCEQLLQ